MSQTIRVILNPAAGHGNGLRSLPAIRAAFEQQKIPLDLVLTESAGHAVSLARKAAQEGVEIIVAAGGDGTLNEVVNGLLSLERSAVDLPAVGVLCAGRGNDFAGSVGIPVEMDPAVRMIQSMPPRRLDIGRVCGGIVPDGRYFINNTGIGFDAVGTIEAQKLPRWGGYASFLIAIFKTVFLYNHAPMAEITFNGRTISQRSLMISMMNGRRLGGGFLMAPNSRVDDGLLDLCIAEQMSSLQILRLIPHFTKGTQATQKTIKTGQAKSITIHALDGPLPTQTDGEIISTEGHEISVEVHPGRLRVIYPEQVKSV